MESKTCKICPVCGTVFEPPPYSKDRIYCNENCEKTAARQRDEVEHPNALRPVTKYINGVRVTTFERTCKVCGKVFEPRNPGRKQIYCTAECRAVAHKEQVQRSSAAKAAKRKQIRKTPKVNLSPLGSKCKKADCVYKGKSVKTCDYMLLTGQPRGCPADNCTRYKPKESNENE